MYKKLLLLSMAALILLSGCKKPPNPSSDIAPGSKNTLTLPMLSEPFTFNPCAIAEGDTDSITQNLFSRMVKLNSKGDIIPDLTTEWKWSDDGLSLNFKIATGVKWHDGTSFSGNDIKYTLDAIKNQDGILKENLASVKEVTLPDKTHVQIDFHYHDPFILYALSDKAASILPKHLFEGHDWLTAPAVFAPVGTGAYKFSSKVEGESLILEANSSYFEGAPIIPILQYRMFKSADEARLAFEEGRIDVLDTAMSLSSVVKYIVNPEYTVIAVDDASRIYLSFNANNGALTPEFRKAIAYGINRDEIFKTALLGIGQVSEGFISPKFENYFSSLATLPSYDPARAIELLSAAGERNADGFFIRVTLKVYDAEPYPEIAAIIKRNLAEVGIDVTVVQTDFAEWQDSVFASGDFEMALAGGTQGPYPEAIVHRISTGGSLNFSGFSNAEIDNRLFMAMTEKEQRKRIELLKDVQFYAAEHLPFIPISEWYTIVTMKKTISNPPAGSLEVGLYEWHKTSIK